MKNELIKLGSRLKQIEGGKILDVATGRGEFVQMLSRSLKNFDEIIGIDSDRKAIHSSRDEFPDTKYKFELQDAYHLDFPDNSFDLVALSNSLHHFAEPEKVIREMKRVLKPGGYFLINEMHRDDEQTETQKTHILFHHWWGKVDSLQGIVHDQTYTSEELEELFETADLHEEEVFHYFYEMPNPKDKNVIHRLLSIMDPYVDRVKDRPEYDDLKEEGSVLKERLQSIGFAPAQSVFMIGKK